MAYTEVSVYGYITGDDLELFSGLTYVNVDARYTEAHVMGKVTMAERFVRALIVDPPSTATDGIIVAVTIMAERYMFMQMVKDSWKEMDKVTQTEQFFDKVVSLALRGAEYSPVDSIPMQGIDL